MAWPRIVDREKVEPVATAEKHIHDVTTELATIDGEAHIISVCVQQLEPLKPEARARVFTYLYQRLGHVEKNS